MNLEEMKKNGSNKIEITDALNAPLLQLKISLNANATIQKGKKLEIYIDDHESDQTNRKTVTYSLSRSLQRNESFVFEPKFKGNKITMNALVERYTKEELAEKEISVGDDLSGKTLLLNFPDHLGTYGNYYLGLFSSEKYRIREQYNNGINVIEIQDIESTEIIATLYQDDSINLKSYTLPDDFGEVTNVINKDNSNALPLTYIKYQGTNIIASEKTEENITYIPVVLKTGKNIISTNYEGADIELVYPKNNDLVKYFLASCFSNTFNNEDKFLTLDDIYFKDCFTQLDDNLINALFNKLTIKCMNSTKNNFSLDCDGNLVVNSLTTKVKEPTPELTELNSLKISSLSSKNNSFSLDSEGNLKVNSIITNVKDSDENALTFNKIYPVGSIYTSVVNTNPGTLFGGTWTRFAQGKVLVGVNESEAEFNTVLKTGGSKNLQAHSHTGNTEDNGNHQHDIYSGYGDGGSYGQDALEFKQALSGRNYYRAATGGVAFIQTAGNHNHSFTTYSTGSGNAQNLQPYVTVYFWHRTA